MSLLLRRRAVVAPPVPENGPSGGANWLRGRRAPFDYSPRKQRRGKRDEILFIGQGGKA